MTDLLDALTRPTIVAFVVTSMFGMGCSLTAERVRGSLRDGRLVGW